MFYGRNKRTVTVIQVPRITRSILDKRGEVVAPLRPAGTVIIDGERVDVVSFGDYIMPGALVEIVKVEGNKLFVQEVKTN